MNAQTKEELQAKKAEKQAEANAAQAEANKLQAQIDALPGWRIGAFGTIGARFLILIIGMHKALQITIRGLSVLRSMLMPI